MKNVLYLIALITLSLSVALPCTGQNYACIQPGQKPYFTNGNGYLRAMRIDSVKAVGGDTIYYPFKTWRYTPSYDSTGSWFGSRIIKRTDGTFLFNNMWTDTVVIKSQAVPGDSWIFYNDTSSKYYIATVTGIDTASIAGTTDSIKTIRITCYTGSSADLSDTLSYFEIGLSKHYGFLQIFDLYTFPYRSTSSGGSLNYYDVYLKLVTLPPLSSGIPGGQRISRHNSLFKRAYPHSPTGLEVYDFAVGDAFLVSGYHNNSGGSASSSWQYYDSVVEKTVLNAYHTTYRTHRIVKRIIYSPPTIYSFSVGTGYFDADTSILMNLDVVPEELNAARFPTVYYYRPIDTSACATSAYFAVDVPVLFEGCNDRHVFKTGFPEIEYATFTPPTPDDIGCHTSDEQILVFSIKNGVMCGSYSQVPNAVRDPSADKRVTIYPNPATEAVSISCDKDLGSVQILNMQGQMVFNETYAAKQASVSVRHIPAGMYIVKIGGVISGKFVKQ